MCENPRTTRTEAEWDALRDADIDARKANRDLLPSDPNTETLQTGNTDVIPFTPRFDLTGPWHGPRGRIHVTEASQLGQDGYRGLPEAAFQATWPENPDAYSQYQKALLESDAIRQAFADPAPEQQILIDQMQQPETSA